MAFKAWLSTPATSDSIDRSAGRVTPGREKRDAYVEDIDIHARQEMPPIVRLDVRGQYPVPHALLGSCLEWIWQRHLQNNKCIELRSLE